MKPERWQQLDQLFHSAMERESSERTAFLDEACGAPKQINIVLNWSEESRYRSRY